MLLSSTATNENALFELNPPTEHLEESSYIYHIKLLAVYGRHRVMRYGESLRTVYCVGSMREYHIDHLTF